MKKFALLDDNSTCKTNFANESLQTLLASNKANFFKKKKSPTKVIDYAYAVAIQSQTITEWGKCWKQIMEASEKTEGIFARWLFSWTLTLSIYCTITTTEIFNSARRNILLYFPKTHLPKKRMERVTTQQLHHQFSINTDYIARLGSSDWYLLRKPLLLVVLTAQISLPHFSKWYAKACSVTILQLPNHSTGIPPLGSH